MLFLEAFIPAYPRGLSFGTKVGSRAESRPKDRFRYWNNAIPVPGEYVVEPVFGKEEIIATDLN